MWVEQFAEPNQPAIKPIRAPWRAIPAAAPGSSDNILILSAPIARRSAARLFGLGVRRPASLTAEARRRIAWIQIGASSRSLLSAIHCAVRRALSEVKRSSSNSAAVIRSARK